jgi:aspartokinase
VGSAEILEIYPLKIQRGLTQLSFLRIPTRPGATRPLFDLLEHHGVAVRFLIEGCAGDYNRDLIVCIDSEAFTRLEPELKKVEIRMQNQSLELRHSVAIIRVLGPHFDIRPGTSSLLFGALQKADITIFSNATTITSSVCHSR